MYYKVRKVARVFKLHRGLKTIAVGPKQTKPSYLTIWSRNSLIIPHLVGLRIAVYNGRHMHSFMVKSEMVGFPLGSFSLTKKLGYKIHIKKKKNKKKKK
jgi:small subunit ribosomal protein S19